MAIRRSQIGYENGDKGGVCASTSGLGVNVTKQGAQK